MLRLTSFIVIVFTAASCGGSSGQNYPDSAVSS